jgi:hypothetical protein
LSAFVWAGGVEYGQPIPTIGPMHSWQIDISEDGAPASIRSTDIIDPEYQWDSVLLVLLGTLNFMNCRNVALVEPQRPRPERRRLASMGVTVKTLSVFPVGKAAIGRAAERYGAGTPLTSVRGTFRKYGPKYDRGLLFGKYEGQFWVPQHARGSAEHGTVEKDYRLVPS